MEIHFIYISIHIFLILKNPWQLLIHCLLVHHFHHVSFYDLSLPLDTKQIYTWPILTISLVYPYWTALVIIDSDHDAYLKLPIL